MPSANRRRHAFRWTTISIRNALIASTTYLPMGFQTISIFGEMEMDSKFYRDISDKMKLPNDVQLQPWQYEMLEHKANRNMNAFLLWPLNTNSISVWSVAPAPVRRPSLKPCPIWYRQKPVLLRWKTRMSLTCPCTLIMPISFTKAISRQNVDCRLYAFKTRPGFPD